MVEFQKIKEVMYAYYSKKDVQQAIYEFCKNRETVPRYFEGFGKRPDMLEYPTDVYNLVKKGTSSFHCSEELWQDPLSISTDMTPEEYNEQRIGWDFLIDIDSKYLDYSKIAAKLLIQALEYHGMKNVGIKYSGSKGFHIIIPWKAFPKEVNGIQTKDMFPEWPRAIANYLHDMINDKLTQAIHKESNLEEHYEIIYKPTQEKAITQTRTLYKCPNCKSEVINTKSTRDKLRCNVCNYDMQKINQEEYYLAGEDNSIKSPDKFEKKLTSNQLIDSVDIVLVASRHLFRAPYSLHEKTGLSSMVLENNEIENFDPNQAHPLKVQIKNFMPEPKEEEARELLLQALDYVKKNPEKKKKYEGKSIDLKGLTINESMFPECIKKILKGVKQDGRKRALFILLGFYNSLEFPQDYIEEKILKWNKKNYKPLKQGYIKSQIDWSAKNKIMPPNCNSHFYKELNVNCKCQNTKNPVSYTIKQAFKFARTNPQQANQESNNQQENQNK